MPAQMIISLANKAGVSKKKAEEYWSKAKKIAGKSGRNPDKTGKKEDYKYVTGIVKKMMGLKSEGEEGSCTTPGMKIKSKGKGRGLVRGKGNGPIGRMADEAIDRVLEGESAAEVISSIAAQESPK